jgi:uncharacterized RDD family membrane protein YckC
MPPAPPAYQQMPPAAGYGGPPLPPNLAQWPQRALSGLIDYFAPYVVVFILFEISHILGLLAWLAALVFIIYNQYLDGATGKSYGRQVAGTTLVRAADGQLIGGGMGVVRLLAHIIDGIPCYVGYLWPLWDVKRQTFADKIVGTYVLKD